MSHEADERRIVRIREFYAVHGAAWAVIENAGYVGECVICWNHTSESNARTYAQSHYDADELEELHVDIAHWDADGEFWSYDH